MTAESDRSSVGIWEKVDFDIAPVAATSEDDPGESEGETRSSRIPAPSQRLIAFLDIISLLFWAYAFMKVFLGDFDSSVAESVSPTVATALELKVFVLLLVLAIVAAIFKRFAVVLSMLYLLAWPVIVLLWKLPRAIYRTRSFLVLLAVLNLASSVVAHFRFTVVTIASFAIAALGAVAAGSDWMAYTSVVAIGVLILLSFGRAIWLSVRPSEFLIMQQSAIHRAMGSSIVRQLTSPSETLTSADIVKFTPAQQDQFVMSLTGSVFAYHFLNFWAFQIDRYRKSRTALLFGGLAFTGLVLKTIVGLSLINWGIYRADPNAFTTSEASTSFASFVRYSIASMWGSEISAIQPGNDLTNLVAIGSVVCGLLIISTLLTTVFFSFQQSRFDQEAADTVNKIRAQGAELERRMRGEFEVSVSEAIRRLEQLRSGLLGIALYFAQRMPDDFEDTS